ncbi:MAG: MtN3 and saliva related transmembrane protein [Candidatus Deianiraeaceae bacterium]|jgi:MtN3 and saliva related transmembrane protein
MTIEIIGIIGGILTTFCLVPQAIRIYITKDTHSISLIHNIMLTTGVLLWVVYGFAQHDKVILYANVVTFILAFAMMSYKTWNVAVHQEKI